MLRTIDCGRDGFKDCLLVWMEDATVLLSLSCSYCLVGKATADFALETKLGERLTWGATVRAEWIGRL